MCMCHISGTGKTATIKAWFIAIFHTNSCKAMVNTFFFSSEVIEKIDTNVISVHQVLGQGVISLAISLKRARLAVFTGIVKLS